MIHWYQNLYMDDVVKKHPARCKKRVERRRPWKKKYYVIVLPLNEDNLFEIMETRQLFFRRYGYLDMYVLGLTVSYESAVAVLQDILMEIYRKDKAFQPKQYFNKTDFL